jgi:hypothetical protein
MIVRILVLTMGLAATVVPSLAHHSFAAEYDPKKPLTVTGPVTKVEWLNPHARVYVDVKDDSGKTTNWEFELGAPNSLIRSGWTRTSIKPGDVVTIEAYRAKDGSNIGNARSISLPDGRKLAAGSPLDEKEESK